MNYFKHYCLLITKRKHEPISDTGYGEYHHIFPRCLGGSDCSSNIVKLYPEEHYVAHLLLAKIFNSPKLWYSCVMMSSGLSKRNNKCYAWVRNKVNSIRSIEIREMWARKSGFENYDDQCYKIWKMHTEDRVPMSDIAKFYNIGGGRVGACIRYYCDNNGLHDVLSNTKKQVRSSTSKKIRANFTPEQEKKRIDATKRADYSNRANHKGENNPMWGRRFNRPKILCPHCNRIVGGKRWHFDNCREKHNENKINNS